MIDVRLKTIGGPEIGAVLASADSGIRAGLREELAAIGEEIVSRAQANARSDHPRSTGIMASRITWYFGREVKRSRGKGRQDQGSGMFRGKYRAIVDEEPSKYARKSFRQKYQGAIFFTARPMGRVAHLVERGVNATFYQSTGLRKNAAHNFERAPIGPFGGGVMEGPRFKYQRSLSIPAKPFFMPAVESVGGASGVNDRLQRRLDWLAGNLASRAA